MDVTTINVIVGVTLTFIGSLALFLLGLIVAYIRNINKGMKELIISVTKHETIITSHERKLEVMEERIEKIAL